MNSLWQKQKKARIRSAVNSSSNRTSSSSSSSNNPQTTMAQNTLLRPRSAVLVVVYIVLWVHKFWYTLPLNGIGDQYGMVNGNENGFWTRTCSMPKCLSSPPADVLRTNLFVPCVTILQFFLVYCTSSCFHKKSAYRSQYKLFSQIG